MKSRTLPRMQYFSITSLFVLAVIGLFFTGCDNKPESRYYIGADISFVPQMEAHGTVFKENGVQKDLLEIMKTYHFNIVRLRIFYNPAAENGYSREGYCGLEQTKLMAKRIKAAGMDFALDFHYSDTWADPDKQYIPSAWKGLSGKILEDSLYNYTKMVLTELKKQGTPPQIVQVGNEIINGMVWPNGKVEDTSGEAEWDAFAGLYNAGVEATRNVLPKAKIMIHLALGGQNNRSRLILDKLLAHGAEFDIIGESYYAQWHGTYTDLQKNLADLSQRYNRPVLVCEYTAPGVKDVNEIVMSIPNKKGIGSMIWEPAPRLLFDRDGNTNNEMKAYLKVAENALLWQKSEFKYENQVKIISTSIFNEPVIGADISWVQQQEDKGTVFSDQGKKKDILEIMKDYKFNWIRLRLFVNPKTENGYSKEGYCDLEHTMAMAKRIKKAGMMFLLDFHYSDNWADPGKQFIPKSWESNTSSANMERTIYQYTKDVIEKLKAQDATPDMVQVGNEINHGFLWPFGKNDSTWTHFCGSLRVASAAVRAADPNIKVMVHIALGGQNKESVFFLDKIIENDVYFDVIGESYYPRWHGTLDELKTNLADLGVKYKKPIIVVEYSDWKQAVNDIAASLPKEVCPGTFIWEATSPKWGNLFDKNGQANDSIKIYPAIYKKLKARN
jgi:arabinogalactan endo-1,4-beta-galactosidase